MAQFTSYEPGTPAWVELMTSDPEGSRSFYGRLLGWEFEIGDEEFGHYTMCRLNDQNVAGMGGDPASEGMPTAWTTYIATDDTDEVAQRIADNGGQVVMGPMDISDQGRMLVASDPTGAVFGTWEAGALIGASVANEPGSVSWNELATRDLDAAQEFYTKVFGYSWNDEDTGEGGPPYRTFQLNGRTVGGALEMTGDWPQEIPAHWMPYFQVGDADAAASEAERLGGAVSVPPTDSPFGRFAVLRDPQGGVFTVMASNALQPAAG